MSGHRVTKSYHGEPCGYEAFELLEEIRDRDLGFP